MLIPWKIDMYRAKFIYNLIDLQKFRDSKTLGAISGINDGTASERNSMGFKSEP